MENKNNLIHSFNHTPDTEGNFNGLTKREYFAVLAMQGILSNPIFSKDLSGNRSLYVSSEVAKYSAYNADALLNELEKTKTP
jgi:hypothetical protein